MTGDQNLRVLGRVPEAVDEDLGSRWVERDFRLFYADQSAIGSAVPGALEQCHEHTERPERAVGHVVGEESPGVLRAPNLLPELEGLARAYRPPPNAGDAGHDLSQVCLDSLDELGWEIGQYARHVASITLEEVTGIG